MSLQESFLQSVKVLKVLFVQEGINREGNVRVGILWGELAG